MNNLQRGQLADARTGEGYAPARRPNRGREGPRRANGALSVRTRKMTFGLLFFVPIPQAWKKRWFVLRSGRLTGDPDVLEYYKNDNAKKPIRVIDLNLCEQV